VLVEEDDDKKEVDQSIMQDAKVMFRRDFISMKMSIQDSGIWLQYPEVYSSC
jgi:hypothetical protein